MATSHEASDEGIITRVRVEGLFGLFDHDLGFGEHKPANTNLLIFYGENGTGKTTLLSLIYHLLNKESRRGHRTYLVRQQFKLLEVTFANGMKISAEREASSVGSFVMRFSREGSVPQSFLFETAPNGTIPAAVTEEPAYIKFTEILPTFSFGFLAHDRSTRIDPARKNRMRGSPQVGTGVREETSPIRSSITNALATTRRQALLSSNRGQLTVNGIYAELIQRIALVALTPPDSGIEEARFKLLERLRDQARVTQQYSKFGLISELQVGGMLETLKAMPPSRVDIVDKVLEPFLLGNEARLNALKPLYIALTTAVETINSLYLNKQISLHLEAGLTISTPGGFLAPERLSSGEQELLILFCEVISSLKPNTIFFIDEPELSLNVSWQRVLLNALLKCAGGSTVQFVVATHSIELLANHRSNVVRLSNRVTPGEIPSPPSAEQVVG